MPSVLYGATKSDILLNDIAVLFFRQKIIGGLRGLIKENLKHVITHFLLSCQESLTRLVRPGRGPTVPNTVGASFLIISGGSGARSLSSDYSRSVLKLRILSIVDTGLPVSSRS